MAGKTLTGIGEDESGRHELGADTSDSEIGARSLDRSVKADNPDKPLSARPTDRMPMYLPSAPSTTPTVRTGAMAAVDEDKVAEGLKKLRSLDEPLGPIPTSTTPTLKENLPSIGLPTPIHSTPGTPTLKEGIPVVGPPAPVNPAAIAAAAAAELIRSRGTAHGHALASAIGQGRLPVSVDDRLKGTLLGHDLHLPDLPALPPEDQRPAEIRPVSRRETPTALINESRPEVDRRSDSHFSHGDSNFFDSEPENNEYEPEHPRSKLMVRGAIFAGVVAVFVVAAVAWVRFHKAETPPPVEAHAAPAAAPPSAADNSGSPGAAPAAAPTEAEPTAAAPTEAQPAAAAPPHRPPRPRRQAPPRRHRRSPPRPRRSSRPPPSPRRRRTRRSSAATPSPSQLLLQDRWYRQRRASRGPPRPHTKPSPPFPASARRTKIPTAPCP